MPDKYPDVSKTAIAPAPIVWQGRSVSGGPGRPETRRAYSITAAQPPLRTIFTGIRVEASTMRTRRL